MPLPPPPLRNLQRMILASAQTSQGLAATLGASAGAFNVNVDDSPFKINVAKDKRLKMDGTTGKYPSSLATQSATLSFDAQMIGGASAAWASTFLPACGFAGSGGTYTYTPLAISPTPLLTLSTYEGGRYRTITDAQGSVKFSGESGRMGKASFTFTGLLADDADGAAVSPTRPSTILPRWVTPMTFGSYVPRCSKWEVDAAAEVILREAATGTGYYSALIVDENSKLTIDPEADLVANQPFLAGLKASTEYAWSIVLGTISGNLVTLSSSKAEITEDNPGARNKLITDGLGCQLNDAFSVILG